MNPFSLVYDALWELAIANPDMASLVRLGNRINYNKENDRDPSKKEVMDADLPELVLVSEGLTAALTNTSSSSMIKRSYTFIVTTGDMRLGYRLFPVEWELFVALVNWKQVLGLLEWNSRSFVKRADVTSVTAGLNDGQNNRGIRGWSAIWRCEVEMHFKTSDLLAELT